MRKKYWTGVLTVLLLAGCAQLGIGVTNIGDLQANPQKFAAKEVTIKGKVTNVLDLPLVTTKIYAVQDDSGTISVKTERAVPEVGTAVRVKGSVDSIWKTGGQPTGLYLREIERW